MSLHHSPRIITDGLVLCLDAINLKSYSGNGLTWTGLLDSSYATLGANTLYNTSGYFGLDGTVNSAIVTAGITYPSTWSQPTSFEMWTYFDSDGTWHNTNRGGLFSRGSTAGTFGLIRRNVNNEVGMWLRHDTATIQVYGTVTSNTWVHIVGTWDGTSNVNLYINGTVSSSANGSPTGSPDVGNYSLGGQGNTLNSAPGNYMKGRIAVAKIYDKELNINEVQQNFQALRGRYGI
jgi:hypothetical protein